MATDNMFSDLSRMIDQIGKDKGIDKQVIVDAVVQGMLVAARKKYGTYREIEAQFNEELGEVELIEFKEVVEANSFQDDEVEIRYEDAIELDPDVQIGDSVGIHMDTRDLGRIAAQMAKQIILQKVRDAERDIIYAEFEQRKGEIASGIARRVEKGAIVVDLGRTEAFLPLREQIPGEQFKPGDRVQGYLVDVRQTTKGPQIIMSRADERYLMKLFEIEVPEIYEGIVEIMAAAREPGQRAKIAVRTNDQSVDPVGACVGMKGSRVQNIVQELKGEKIDIVNWNESAATFVCNALAPAEISKVYIDEENHIMEVIIPDHQLSLAIGKKGQNVRLAAKLTTWKLDIMSESQAANKAAEAIFNLMLIPGMKDETAQLLFQSGFNNFQDVADASVDEIMTVPGMDEERARKLIDDSHALSEKYKAEGTAIPTAGLEKGGGAKALADMRLKAELDKLNQTEDSASSSNEN